MLRKKTHKEGTKAERKKSSLDSCHVLFQKNKYMCIYIIQYTYWKFNECMMVKSACTGRCKGRVFLEALATGGGGDFWSK